MKFILLSNIFQTFWEWRLRSFPEFATSIGNHMYDNELDDMSLNAYSRRKEEVEEHLREIVRFEAPPDASIEDRLNLQLLKTDLQQFVAGYAFKAFLFPINQLEGPQLDFPRLISYMKTETPQQYDMILERLKKFPVQVDQIISLLQKGIEEKYVMSDVSITPVPTQIASLIAKPLEDSQFFAPFTKNNTDIEDLVWKDTVDKAKLVIREAVVPAFRKLDTYLKTTYIPEARNCTSASSLPNGAEFYQECLKFHTTTNLTAKEIHDIGKAEVKRISLRMEAIKDKVKFNGSLKDFSQHLREDQRFALSNKEDILSRYRRICSVIETKLPLLFKTFPVAKYEIVTVPDEVAANFPGAYYLAPPGDGSRPGTFFVNTYEPESRKIYEFVSLALHEAIPGHHHQACLSLELKNTPDFRRYFEDRHYYEVPSRFTMNTAYLEGWGLYSEFLGEEMGMYEDPYDLFGRLSHEMLRAARLVVDTGMHAFGWTRDDSIKFMLDNTAMSKNDAKAEVERYITWPGQACAYKIGELKIKELRQKATNALGDKFDIKEFHDVVLLSGSLPLDVLEGKIDEYIGSNQ